MRLTQEECAKKLAGWLRENAGYTYADSDDNLRGFGIDGEVDLMDLAIFVLDTICEPSNQRCDVCGHQPCQPR